MQPPEPRPVSTGPVLPVAALVLSMVGLCLPPLLLVSGALGLYGYLRARKEPLWAPRKQLTQMTMAVSAAGLLIFTGLALPNFKRVQLRLRQRECRDTLAVLVAAQERYYAANKVWAPRLELLDAPAVSGRALLRLAQEGAPEGLVDPRIDAAIPKLVMAEVGVHGTCPACSITMLCAAQLDGDDAVDVWTVSTIERSGNRGEKIAGGFPWNEVDDVVEDGAKPQ